jgi:hypothetical protein
MSRPSSCLKWERLALVAGLEDWMRAERAKLSRHAAVAKAIDYMLTRWGAFTRFLHDRRICLTNNAAERALRGLAWAGSRGCLLVQSTGGTDGLVVDAHPNRKAQQRRSASLAHQRSRPDRRRAADEACGATAVELARGSLAPKGGIAAATPKGTIRRTMCSNSLGTAGRASPKFNAEAMFHGACSRRRLPRACAIRIS